MKRIAALILFLLPLICFATSRDTSSNLPILNWTNSVAGTSFADNTAAIQALINTGGTLTTGAYNITSLSMTNSFNFNGSTIAALSTTGAMLNCNTAGVTVQNVGLNGGNGTYNASGLSGVAINAANVTLIQVSVSNVSNYGIVGGAFSNEVINTCSVSNSGYIGISLITNTTAVTGIVVTNTSINRAAQGIGVQQACLIVRNNAGVGGSMTGSVITNNVFTQASNPTSAAGECFEIRNNVNAIITGNSYAGGSIGLSMVGCTTTRSPTGTYSNQSLEAIEISNDYSSSAGGTITSGKVGVFVDGNTPMANDTITTSTMSGLTSYPIQVNPIGPPAQTIAQAQATIVSLFINNVTASTTTYAIYDHYAQNVTINNSTFTGNNTSYAILFDTSPGGMNLNNSAFNNFIPKIMNTFSSSPQTVNNIIGTGVTPVGAFLSVNAGANVTLGSNIHFNAVVVTPPNISYPTPQVYTQNVGIAPLNVTNSGGAVTGFSVTPALPLSLVLNTVSGQISGLPTVITPTSTYSIKAVNSAGSSTFPLVITVNAQKPKISYAPTSQTYTQFIPIAPWNPINLGGVSVKWSISPSLPSGLTFSNSTGSITGTPTSVLALSSFKVKAVNTGGVDSTTIQLTVRIALPIISYTPFSNTFTVGTPISHLNVTSTGGSVVSYSISPSLPTGLSLNTSTGQISGTPTASSPSVTYLVTASNASGVGFGSVAIQVNNIAPNISYAPDTLNYVQFINIVPVSPTNTGGSATYTISPTLPSGLLFDTTTGILFGTPLLASPATNYLVTASNASGSSNATLNITVTGNTVNVIRIKGKTGVIVFPP